MTLRHRFGPGVDRLARAVLGGRHDHAADAEGDEHDAHGHEHQSADVAGHESAHGHSHDHTRWFDDSLLASRAGMRALVVSVVGLLGTAALQLVVALISGSVGLVAETIHNAADATTAIPVGIAFLLGRRGATRRYTYGFGRAEDLAGLAVVAVVAGSAVVAGVQAVDRLLHPHPVSALPWVAVAGMIGFLGNETAARYRIGVGRRIGSAALVADGEHARADGLTSLAVVAGAVGVALGWPLADPVAALLITAAILVVLSRAAIQVYERLMDAVDERLVDAVERHAAALDGVRRVDHVRLRWVGHELRAELDLTVDGNPTVAEAHDLAERVRHHLLHSIPRLADATIHVHPGDASPEDQHLLTAHHRPSAVP